MHQHTSHSSAKQLRYFIQEKASFLAWAWAGIIAIIMLIPGNVIPKVPEWSDLLTWDKLVHLFLFSTFGLLVFNNLRQKPRFVSRPWYQPAILAVLLGIVFGASLELLQAILPIGRSGNKVDFIADMAGSLAAYGISWYLAVKAK